MFGGQGVSPLPQRRCVPTNGVPFRTGIYLIQAFNGQFVEDIHNHPQVNSQHYSDITVIPVGYVEAEVTGLSTKTGEWMIKFHGASDNLYENYFYIISGYKGDDFKVQRLLTLDMTNANEKLTLREQIAEEDEILTQKWYMIPTRTERGLLEVKIFAKINGLKYFVTIDPVHVKKYKGEYHYLLPDDDSNHRPDVHKHDPHFTKSILRYSDEPEIDLGQTFRLFECEYYLSSGVPNRGLTRNEPSGDAADLRAMIDDMNWAKIGDELSYPDTSLLARSEEAFRDLFGISQERFVYMLRQKKESDNNHSDLPRQISLALSESSTIWDYAGRMRIGEKQFKVMYDVWSLFGFDTDSMPHGTCVDNKDKACLESKKKMEIYIKSKVNGNFMNTTFIIPG